MLQAFTKGRAHSWAECLGSDPVSWPILSCPSCSKKPSFAPDFHPLPGGFWQPGAPRSPELQSLLMGDPGKGWRTFNLRWKVLGFMPTQPGMQGRELFPYARGRLAKDTEWRGRHPREPPRSLSDNPLVHVLHWQRFLSGPPENRVPPPPQPKYSDWAVLGVGGGVTKNSCVNMRRGAHLVSSDYEDVYIHTSTHILLIQYHV